MKKRGDEAQNVHGEARKDNLRIEEHLEALFGFQTARRGMSTSQENQQGHYMGRMFG